MKRKSKILIANCLILIFAASCGPSRWIVEYHENLENIITGNHQVYLCIDHMPPWEINSLQTQFKYAGFDPEYEVKNKSVYIILTREMIEYQKPKFLWFERGGILKRRHIENIEQLY
jgi:hypothetical protein